MLKGEKHNNLNQVSCLTINQQIFNELHEPYPS